MARIGLISDTHGLLRPEALAFLAGCVHIIHGGDIGDPRILDALSALAPLTAVRGNNDRGHWAEALPEVAFLESGGVLIQVIHDLAGLGKGGPDPGVRVVVSGHSHIPALAERAGVLYVNPGSAGPRRFRLPVSVAELAVEAGSASARLVTLALPAGGGVEAPGRNTRKQPSPRS
jgi:putative phosphoesterase